MDIVRKIAATRVLIQDLERKYHRPDGSVKIVAVSKGQSIDAIQEARSAGIHDFGESYIQEALPKIKHFSAAPPSWHFIGTLQSNKLKWIAEDFDWVHSLMNLSSAEKLNRLRSESQVPLNVCIQIKADVLESTAENPEKLLELAKQITEFKHLSLRGLMVISPATANRNTQYHCFKTCFSIFQSLNLKLNHNLDTLSIGMSACLEEAIHAGSTLLRLGEIIFGPRSK